MELLQIRYFLDVAQTQHMTRSAQRLHVAQPAVSQAIARLEKELGVPLFRPKGRNIELTTYGSHLRDRLLPLMAGLEKLPEELREMAATESVTIRLYVQAASALVTEAIVDYARMHEHVHFIMMQNAQDAACDISVSTRLHQGDTALDGDMHCLFTERIFMAVPNAGAYIGLEGSNLADFKDEGFISLQESHQMRSICDAYCERAGFAPRYLFESDNPSAVRNMIAARMGIGFWPEFSWGGVDADRVRLIPILQPDCRRDLIIRRKQNKADNTEVTRFVEFLTDFFKQRQHAP